VAARAYAGSRTHSGAGRRRPARRPSRRPAPRRPRARRGPSRINWERAGRIALTLVLAAVLFSYLNPLVTFVETYRDTTAAKAELRSLQAENRQLHNRVQSADEPSVLEREARRQGMTRPGEIPYVVRGLRG
jgi:cell division protein FtsB